VSDGTSTTPTPAFGRWLGSMDINTHRFFEDTWAVALPFSELEHLNCHKYHWLNLPQKGICHG